jgi:hypothetical protein
MGKSFPPFFSFFGKLNGAEKALVRFEIAAIGEFAFFFFLLKEIFFLCFQNKLVAHRPEPQQTPKRLKNCESSF